MYLTLGLNMDQHATPKDTENQINTTGESETLQHFLAHVVHCAMYLRQGVLLNKEIEYSFSIFQSAVMFFNMKE